MALAHPSQLKQLFSTTGKKPKTNPIVHQFDFFRHDGFARNSKRKYQSVRLLGIDPGTRYVGWGLIELSGRGPQIPGLKPQASSLRLLDCGCISPSAKLELKSRLCEIFAQLEIIIRRSRPDAAALEETFAGVNMKSAIAMGEGRGIALLCLARANLSVLEISPRSIKQAVTGSGAATKARVAAMVCAHLDLKEAPKPEDTTDALAAAIALAQRIGRMA